MLTLSNLSFNVRGSYFPSDHNYGLYASLINFNPNLRQLNWQLGTIQGFKQHNYTNLYKPRSFNVQVVNR
jgi:hypothetical protein